ncbi:TonB-dependent siderophore receptor [Gloeocapsopsis sp. IPPAS B-1203]|uniref:TonB-dependent siderophore receptor n=1 Tax=Gloeocapsopsis sp. IPPAS B-1203 TaxID=2049454 RepID=UPI000C17761A|nr:TonB-dependent siderophore receptor [Gloeocapsopsis sp. IPPAS B-1203]PIG95191.1 TonB-dependent siderophore receptor [Gloeocapsopsis sp. IPPAS B-1203]
MFFLNGDRAVGEKREMKRLMLDMGTVAPLVTIFTILSVQSAGAIEVDVASCAIASSLSLSDIKQPATTIDEWLTQIAQTSIVQITQVQLDSTDGEMTLTLQTTGELATPTTSVVGNALIADIPNAALVLPEGDEFSAAEPADGITLINITNLPNNRVRVVITGTEAPPTAEIIAEASRLAFSVTPRTATGTDDDTIEIVVIGEEEGSDYFIPNASTATRTDTLILDIPQSIQVIPQQILEDQQILQIDDALRNVSGVIGSYDAFGAGATLTLRGFTTDSFSNGPIVRDGFRVYDNLGVQETANLEQIEIIRGPSSVLFGQNDPGGIINLVTKQPLLAPLYKFQLQAGSFGLIRPSLDFSEPLNEDASLRYRLNAAYQRQDGFRDFNTLSERFFVAPVLSWNSDRTRFSLALEYLDDEAPFDTGLIASGDRVIDVPFDRNFNEPDDFRRSQSLNLGYNLEHQLSDNWTLRNAFRYVGQDYNIQVALPISFDEATGILNRAYAIREYRSDDHSVQTNIVGQFTTGALEHTLLAGVDLNWNRFDERFTKVDFANLVPLNVFDPTYGVIPRPDFSTIAATTPFDTEYDRVGVFLQDQISIGNHFIIVGSLRYDSVDFRNTAEATSRSDSAWSPRLGVVYQPLENLSLYASYSQSFVPSFARGIDGDFLEPETSEGFEIGVKVDLLDGLLATLAYFDITKRNVATVADPLTGASVATGAQRSQGIELDVLGEILPGWNIIGFYAYTDARVTEDNVIPIGNRLPNAPRHSAGLWTTYEIQHGNLQGLGFGLGVNYVSNRFGNLDNDFEIGDYFLTNAALFYRRDNWRVALNVNNLFDVGYITSTNTFNRNSGIRPGEPLSIIGSISISF